MSLPFRGLRLVAAVVLSIPLVPMCWVASTGAYRGGNSSACAATSVTCNTCTPNTCPLLDYNQTLMYTNSVYLNRCIDYDNVPPGHCARVLRNNYNLMYVNRLGYQQYISSCVHEECTSSIIFNDSPCDRPYIIGGGSGGGGGIGE